MLKSLLSAGLLITLAACSTQQHTDKLSPEEMNAIAGYENPGEQPMVETKTAEQ